MGEATERNEGQDVEQDESGPTELVSVYRVHDVIVHGELWLVAVISGSAYFLV